MNKIKDLSLLYPSLLLFGEPWDKKVPQWISPSNNF